MTERLQFRLSALAGALLGLSTAAGAASVTVRVTDAHGAPVDGAAVCACHFTSQGPDAQSQLAFTDPSGTVSFSLTDGARYELLAAAQGYAPGLRAQYADKNHPFVIPDGNPATAAVALSTAAPAGEVDAMVLGATPGSPVLANVRPASGSLALGDGLAVADASGFARVRVFNVPFAAADALVLTAYDPAVRKAVGLSVDRPLDALGPFLSYALDFNSASAVTGVSPLGFRTLGVAANTVDTVRVWPNPFRPTQGHAVVHFDTLPAGARVRVYTVGGAEVFDRAADGTGAVDWDAKNESGAAVASGVYFVLLEGTGGKKIVKVAVQR